MHGDTAQTTPSATSDSGVGTGGMWQVVLFNDSHNTMDHVVACLGRIFGHNRQLAERIMMEAHRRGRAVAEVEPRERAELHRNQLQSCGLTATAEPV